ncbi:MAG: hypothetical protein HC820_05520 [Hydrococcus sp. RM1_1_31]|nr:hypothetical protein [Hydrococcus sp. RM1_1_31]
MTHKHPLLLNKNFLLRCEVRWYNIPENDSWSWIAEIIKDDTFLAKWKRKEFNAIFKGVIQRSDLPQDKPPISYCYNLETGEIEPIEKNHSDRLTKLN